MSWEYQNRIKPVVNWCDFRLFDFRLDDYLALNYGELGESRLNVLSVFELRRFNILMFWICFSDVANGIDGALASNGAEACSLVKR